MEKSSNSKQKELKRQVNDFAETILRESFLFAETVVDTHAHAYLILDKKLRVIAANKIYYSLFRDTKSKVAGKHYKEICDGFFNTLSINKYLALVAKNEHGFFKGLEVKKEFQKKVIKTFLLSGRNIYSQSDNEKIPSEMILLTVEDTSEIMKVADFIIEEYRSTKKK